MRIGRNHGRTALIALVAALSACGQSAAPVAPVAPRTNVRAAATEDTGPFGTWFEMAEGGFVKIDEHEVILVANEQLQRRAAVTSRERDGESWRVSTAIGFAVTIRPAPGGGLELCENGDRCGALRRAASPAHLDAIVAAAPDASTLCARAETCCREAMPLLGGHCDPAAELGDRSPTTCTGFLRGIRMLLSHRTDITPPPSCAAQ